ncbi:hypothetical protein A4R26_33785 [Niastella populi]|uniref:Uncharacterized protein n=1 Tax=Niastella populi TaxID=550983 RepID=A0A1V9G050_9BACT|nr:hypothetical protein A4R26_33785 [Niastella populi]
MWRYKKFQFRDYKNLKKKYSGVFPVFSNPQLKSWLCRNESKEYLYYPKSVKAQKVTRFSFVKAFYFVLFEIGS